MAELRQIIVIHGCHFVRHLGICTPSCVKLLQVMSGIIPSNLQKNDVSISNSFPGVHKCGIHTDTQTHTHTDTHTHTQTHLHVICLLSQFKLQRCTKTRCNLIQNLIQYLKKRLIFLLILKR